MRKNDIIKVINEELREFDFLGNDEQQAEDAELALLSNPDFQKQFICDFLLNKKDKYKITDVVQANINDDWRRDGYLEIDYIIELQYRYDASKEPANFGLQFVGNRVGYHSQSEYSQGSEITPSYEDFWLDEIDWNDIKVNMFMTGDRDDDVEFKAFNKSPERIRHLFINRFIGDFIEKYGDVGIRTPADYDSVEKTGYC